VRANDRQAADGSLSEKRRRNLADGIPEQSPDLPVSIVRNAGQGRFDATPDPLGPTRPRVSVIVSPIQLREGAVPIRRILMFDDHPATLRLLNDVDLAQKRKDKLAVVQFSALILLLLLLMFWRLL
jgi:hypothetical protein